MDSEVRENLIAARTVIGILAHVDAGKTTLSESMLYLSGAVRKKGRVDDKNTTLDTHDLEKERGITIFSSEAQFSIHDRNFTLLDTPGHVDFSAEMERTLNVLDACILVISGTEGVQSHTRTLWRLLSFYHIPTIVFVTKMDYARKTEGELLENLLSELGDGFVSFSENADKEERNELLAMCDEEVLQHYLEEGDVPDADIRDLVDLRKCFPVYFGSGLKGDNVEYFMEGMEKYLPVPSYPNVFGAQVYKVSYDGDNNRLVHMKITGGSLKVKDIVKSGKEQVEEKVNQIRIYTGEKYIAVDSAVAGDICTVTGLSNVENGAGLGYEERNAVAVLEPMMKYSVVLPDQMDPMIVLPKLKRLEEEDPQLKMNWNPYTQEIEVGLMGEIQAEILKSIIKERFDLSVSLGKGHVVYRETITNVVEGVGHYEPLRHYAEVHLLMEPLPRGSGLVFTSDCSTDMLDKNWQRLILQHLVEKEHLGVLTGSPITDMKISIISGRAHLKHTEGGDFRQATYRAVRMGLMNAENLLLEPYYRFRLELPEECLSRAIVDIRKMSGSFLPPVYAGMHSVLTGRAPVITLNDYAKIVSSYTGGVGQLILEPDGYDICHNPEEVISEMNYMAEADLANTPDSVFCAHGAGFPVRWSSVPNYMHIPFRSTKKEEYVYRPREMKKLKISDEDLEEIMMREFGPIRRPQYGTPKRTVKAEKKPKPVKVDGNDLARVRPDLLVVDGYNVIFAWEELKQLANEDIAAARGQLCHILSNYSAFIRCETVVVFDGYRVAGNPGESYDLHNIRVVYTKEKETADLYIQKLLSTIPKQESVRVITSDGIIQLSALRSGVLRQSSLEFQKEVLDASEKISEIIEANRTKTSPKIGDSIQFPDVENK